MNNEKSVSILENELGQKSNEDSCFFYQEILSEPVLLLSTGKKSEISI